VTALLWEIKRASDGTCEVLRDRILMLPIRVAEDFAKDFVRKARNPDDIVKIIDPYGVGRTITSELARRAKKRR
jgi:hypothetical protein